MARWLHKVREKVDIEYRLSPRSRTPAPGSTTRPLASDQGLNGLTANWITR